MVLVSTGEALICSSVLVPLARSPIPILDLMLILSSSWAPKYEPPNLLVPLRSLPVTQETVQWTWEFPMDHNRTLAGHVKNRLAILPYRPPPPAAASRVIACETRGSHGSHRRLANLATKCSLLSLLLTRQVLNRPTVRIQFRFLIEAAAEGNSIVSCFTHPVPGVPLVCCGKHQSPRSIQTWGCENHRTTQRLIDIAGSELISAHCMNSRALD